MTVWTRTADATLMYNAKTAGDDELLFVPMSVLEAVEGSGDESVELAIGRTLNGEARWADRGVPMTRPFDALLPGKQHRLPILPADLDPAPLNLLRALHECGRTAARESGRYALSRVR